MTRTQTSLAAARGVESLIKAARELLADAQVMADEGRLLMISKWLGERVESLDDELLKEVRATVEALEKQRAEEADKS